MQPEETPREAGETAEQVSELDDSVAFGNAATDFAASDDDDTGDIEIVVPPEFQSLERDQPGGTAGNAEGPDAGSDENVEDDANLDDGSEPGLGLDAGDGTDLGLDLDDDDLDLDDLDLDDNLESDDDWGTEEAVSETSGGLADADGSTISSEIGSGGDPQDAREPIPSMPDRAIDDWISNSHEDAHANWLDQAQKGTRSTIIAVVLIALLIAAVAIAFIVATRNSV